MKTYSEVRYTVANCTALYGTNEFLLAVFDQYSTRLPLVKGDSKEYWESQYNLILEWVYKGMPL